MTLEEARKANSAKQYVLSFHGDEEAYYEEFYAACRKYDVVWSEASEGVRHFIEEVTRFNFERKKAKSNGMPLSSVRPVFNI